MTVSTHNHARSTQAVWDMPAGYRRIVAALDLSPLSDRVVGRLALLPLTEGARLTLLHVVPSSLPPRARRRAERDATKALRGEAKSLGRMLPTRVAVDQVVKVGAPAAGIAACARATRAELIVMGRGGGRAWRDAFLGSTAERVIRRAQIPVLAVRLAPRAPYGRPMVALDRDEAAHAVLAMLLRVTPPPRPRPTIIHAFEVPRGGLVYPSLSEEDAEDYRESYRQEATAALEAVLATAMVREQVPPPRVPPWQLVVRAGSPRSIIEKAARKAGSDLLLLGTRGHTGVAHALLGTVAGDILRSVTSDVLVVPPRRTPGRRPDPD